MEKESILVSACLLGKRCRFDNEHRCDKGLLVLLKEFQAIGMCPEESAGLTGPRGPFEIQGNAAGVLDGTSRVVSRQEHDVSSLFIRGARYAAALAEKRNIHIAVLKSKSPSCSPDFVHDGSFSRVLTNGVGVAAYLLQKSGVTIFSPEVFKETYKKVSRR